jgi:hypothetical protein
MCPFAKFIPQREKSRFRLTRVDKYDPDPDPNPERRQNDADPHVDPTVSFTHVGKSEFFLLTFTAVSVHTCCLILLLNVLD